MHLLAFKLTWKLGKPVNIHMRPKSRRQDAVKDLPLTRISPLLPIDTRGIVPTENALMIRVVIQR
jgi:hypothetical protein